MKYGLPGESEWLSETVSNTRRNRGKGNDGNGCLYAVSEDVRRRPGSPERKGYCGMDGTTAGGEGGTSYVGGALYLRDAGIRCGIFFRVQSPVYLLSELMKSRRETVRKRFQGNASARFFWNLQEQGAANINLVTAAHYVTGCDRITEKSEGAGNGSAGDLQFQRIRTGGNGADARRGCGCLASRF